LTPGRDIDGEENERTEVANTQEASRNDLETVGDIEPQVHPDSNTIESCKEVRSKNQSQGRASVGMGNSTVGSQSAGTKTRVISKYEQMFV